MRLVVLLLLVAWASAQCVPSGTDGGRGDGDVHYMTLDGRYFDYQHAGKHVFARVDNELDVQVCLQPWEVTPSYVSDVSVNRLVAVKVGSALVLINGSSVTTTVTGFTSVVSTVTASDFVTTTYATNSLTILVSTTNPSLGLYG